MRERGELPDNQFAFRPGRCTMNAVFIIDTIAGVDIERKVGLPEILDLCGSGKSFY